MQNGDLFQQILFYIWMKYGSSGKVFLCTLENFSNFMYISYWNTII